jgi:hypothetical protein
MRREEHEKREEKERESKRPSWDSGTQGKGKKGFETRAVFFLGD